MNFKPMSEAQIREKFLRDHIAFRDELAELTVEYSKLLLAMGSKIPADNGKLTLAPMVAKMTALQERVTWFTANIEFIEQIGVFDKTRRADSLKQELMRRHALCVVAISRGAADTVAHANDINQLIARSIEQRVIVSIGERVRDRMGSEHARLMKDLAIIGYIQTFGVTSSPAARQR